MLSHADPVFVSDNEIIIPILNNPTKYPIIDFVPKQQPKIKGVEIEKIPGMIISFKAA